MDTGITTMDTKMEKDFESVRSQRIESIYRFQVIRRQIVSTITIKKDGVDEHVCIPLIFSVVKQWTIIKLKYPEQDTEMHIKHLLAYSAILKSLNPSFNAHISEVITCFAISVMKKYKLNMPTKMCYHCALEPEIKMKKCSGCNLAWYCCDDCNAYGWERHKLVCKLLNQDFI